ncbi:MAG TPA: DUF389 domain-containing protein [Polyangia bacterium]
MHRRLTFQGDTGAIGRLADQITDLDGVIGLARWPGGSLKPAGDVLQADVLNQAADEVLRRARPSLEDPAHPMTLVISQSNAVIDREHREMIERDADESLWEEMESDLRNHGRISINYVVLMALGGAVAAAGFLFDPVPEAVAMVGAAIIAPGFEPIAKMAQAIVLKRPYVVLRAFRSVVVGYAVLAAAAAALTFAAGALRLAPQPPHVVPPETARYLARLEAAPIVTSACAAVAGVLMVVSLRDLYVVGPLMVLVLISGVALVGAALARGEGRLAVAALERVGVDVALIVGLGAGVFAWKQRRFHRRRPLP